MNLGKESRAQTLQNGNTVKASDLGGTRVDGALDDEGLQCGVKG